MQKNSDNAFYCISYRTMIRIFLGMTLGLGILSGTGYAKVLPNLLPPVPAELVPYMPLENEADPRTLFSWEEQSFSYVAFPEILPGQKLQLTWIWRHGEKKISRERETFTEISSLAYWEGLEDWVALRQTGDWDVILKWGYAGSLDAGPAESHSFVTPEPFGAVLFLLGGLVLGARKDVYRSWLCIAKTIK